MSSDYIQLLGIPLYTHNIRYKPSWAFYTLDDVVSNHLAIVHQMYGVMASIEDLLYERVEYVYFTRV
jgi:hypothetical protein